MEDEEEEEEIEFKEVHFKNAPVHLADFHSFLFDSVESYLSSQKEGSFLIIGPGMAMLPFSLDCERTRKMLGGKSLVLLDCVFDAEGIAKSVYELSRSGIFGEGFFSLGEIASDARMNSETSLSIEPSKFERETVNYYHTNLRRKDMQIPPRSFDAIDATFAMHYATPYREDLDRIAEELHRLLKDGGLLHIGEGDVDMSYTEEKIASLAKMIDFSPGKAVVIHDERDSDFSVMREFENCSLKDVRSRYKRWHDDNDIMIDSKGDVYIYYYDRGKQKVLDALHNAGYYEKEVFDSFGGHIVVPLIDENNPEDKRLFIEPVSHYYAKIKERVDRCFLEGKINAEDCEEIKKAYDYELSFARKGLVVHCHKKETIVESLKKAGFAIKDVKENEPFCNIVAVCDKAKNEIPKEVANLEIIIKDDDGMKRKVETAMEKWTVAMHRFEENVIAQKHKDYWSSRGYRMMSCSDLYAILSSAIDGKFISDFQEVITEDRIFLDTSFFFGKDESERIGDCTIKKSCEIFHNRGSCTEKNLFSPVFEFIREGKWTYLTNPKKAKFLRAFFGTGDSRFRIRKALKKISERTTFQIYVPFCSESEVNEMSRRAVQLEYTPSYEIGCRNLFSEKRQPSELEFKFPGYISEPKTRLSYGIKN